MMHGILNIKKMKKCYVETSKNVLHTVKGRKANWIIHIARRYCLLKHVIEGRIVGSDRKTRKRP
jgi:hypothetical protein